jgi:hypothetical protein
MLGLGGSAMAVGLALGVVGEATKDMIRIAEEHDAAEKSLAQAVDAYNSSLGTTKSVTRDVTKEIAAHDAAVRHLAEVQAGMPTKHAATTLQLMHLQDAQKGVTDTANKLAAAQGPVTTATDRTAISLEQYRIQIEAFIATNRQFTSSQAEVISGFATLTRAGLTQAEVTRDMTIAVNLSAIKHISLSEAVDLVNKAEHGRFRGLVDLGLVTKAQIGADGELIVGTKDIAAAMAVLEQRTKDGTSALTDDQKATNELGNAWQSFATGPGMELQRSLTNAKQIAAELWQVFQSFGSDNVVWKAFGNQLVLLAAEIHKDIIVPFQEAIDLLGRIGGAVSALGSGIGSLHIPGFASGGIVPGSIGQPQLVVAHGGEQITPAGQLPTGGGGGASVIVNVYGSVQTERDLALTLRETMRRLDREMR